MLTIIRPTLSVLIGLHLSPLIYCLTSLMTKVTLMIAYNGQAHQREQHLAMMTKPQGELPQGLQLQLLPLLISQDCAVLED